MEGREQSRERKAERKEGRSKLMKNKMIKKIMVTCDNTSNTYMAKNI